jgi:hypothetical protein
MTVRRGMMCGLFYLDAASKLKVLQILYCIFIPVASNDLDSNRLIDSQNPLVLQITHL